MLGEKILEQMKLTTLKHQICFYMMKPIF